MAQAMFTQTPQGQQPLHSPYAGKGGLHTPLQPIAASGSPHPSAPLASPLHNPNGTLRKHIPGTKRKITPDGRPMTSLPPEIKRFRNSFLFYVNEQRKRLNNGENDSEEDGSKNREFISNMSKKWREMSDEEKAPYIKMAKEDKERFNREMEEWERKHPGQGPKSKRRKMTINLPGDQAFSSNGPATASVSGGHASSVSSLMADPISAPPTVVRDPTRPPATPMVSTATGKGNRNHHRHREHPGEQQSVAKSLDVAGGDNQGTSAAAAATAELGLTTSELISALSQPPAHDTNGSLYASVPASSAGTIPALSEMMNMSTAELTAMSSSIVPTPVHQVSPIAEAANATSSAAAGQQHLENIATALDQATATAFEQASAIMNSSNVTPQ
ncbi:hypothetical protein EV182_001955 [Spiromyces aspiralis]|uniref:Uncharacterized protein n=1 Tax=Spiromyces aspiralis TaxID=68401 RepID=A0ACC1HFY1_9FUNG|nr:hypothetical protein EV182_001955 [Spiromyces aspiralis]